MCNSRSVWMQVCVSVCVCVWQQQQLVAMVSKRWLGLIELASSPVSTATSCGLSSTRTLRLVPCEFMHIFSEMCARRWRWSPTSWTISCAMSVRVLAVEGNSLPFSALTSPVCSTTASSAGPTSTPAPDESFTSPWWRREPTVHARSTSAGTRDATTAMVGNENTGPQEEEHRSASPALLSYQYNRVRNTIQYILYISIYLL